VPRALANSIELDYETYGDRECGRPLLILRGLGTQRIQWPDAFLEALVRAGHFVVAFDNRDVGESQWFDEAGLPDIPGVMAALREGRDAGLAYSLDDMADDVVGLMDALGLVSAHVAGMSMGGMLTTVVGARHPDRVRSLVAIMASTGNPALPPPTPAAMEALVTPAPREREAFIAHQVRFGKVLASPAWPTPDAERAAMAARVFDRAFHPEGTARQYVAIGASGDRRAALATITAPTLVIHGLADPLVPFEAGRDVAATIPGADLLEIEGMGHDLPVALAPRIADAIASHTAKAEERRT
jgi:pimeloyl-ACP methyl ester carboxylesterase